VKNAKNAKSSPRSIIRSLLAHLAVELRGAARSPDDPDAVHDLRVAIRRLNQALRVFPQVFGPGHVKKIRRRLKKLMTALGAARNLDVAREVLHAAKARPGTRLLHHLRDQRRIAQKHLEVRLKSWRKREILRGWRELAKGAAGASSAPRSLDLAWQELRGLAEEFFAAGNDAARRKTAYHHLHRCRLLGKRLRYSIEMFLPEGSPEIQPRLKLLKELQNHLGGLNDCVTVIELIHGHPAVNQRIRVLLKRREAAFLSFWKREFNLHTQQQWIDSFQPPNKKARTTNGTISTPARRRPTP
jgi:CHAD domain-containing protein